MVSSAAFPAGKIVLVVAAVVDDVMFPAVVTVASVAATLSGVVVTSVVTMGVCCYRLSFFCRENMKKRISTPFNK